MPSGNKSGRKRWNVGGVADSLDDFLNDSIFDYKKPQQKKPDPSPSRVEPTKRAEPRHPPVKDDFDDDDFFG